MAGIPPPLELIMPNHNNIPAVQSNEAEQLGIVAGSEDKSTTGFLRGCKKRQQLLYRRLHRTRDGKTEVIITITFRITKQLEDDVKIVLHSFYPATCCESKSIFSALLQPF